MRFKIHKVQRDVSRVVELDLPRYAHHDLDDSDIYMKMSAVKDNDKYVTVLKVHVDHRKDRVEVEVEMMSTELGQNGEYYLGLGEFECTEKEWLDALREASHLLNIIQEEMK